MPIFEDNAFELQDELVKAQARIEDLERRLAAAGLAERGKHRYLSTSCFHGDHVYCAQSKGKAPAQCKFCDAKCVCSCHAEASPIDADVEVSSEAMRAAVDELPEAPPIDHREFDYTEIGRDEDDVVFEVSCECGWKHESTATKDVARAVAASMWNRHDCQWTTND